jgi:hypothetical protein
MPTIVPEIICKDCGEKAGLPSTQYRAEPFSFSFTPPKGWELATFSGIDTPTKATQWGHCPKHPKPKG